MTGSADARVSVRRQDQSRHASGWWRADVQGLRAMAVLGVVAFHAGLPLRGGFAGVDVFFVISGFVIGGLLLRELGSTNRFSPSTFCLCRARRILPAAALMTVTVVAATAVLLSPLGNVQQSAGQAASAASVFPANVYFFLFTGGYMSRPIRSGKCPAGTVVRTLEGSCSPLHAQLTHQPLDPLVVDHRAHVD